MPNPHPRSILGRLQAGRPHWAGAIPVGGDISLLADAMFHIETLTQRLASTRKHLRQANRTLENRAKAADATCRAGLKMLGLMRLRPDEAQMVAFSVPGASKTAIQALQGASAGPGALLTPETLQNAAPAHPLSEIEAADWYDGVPFPAKSTKLTDQTHITTP